ncbi:MAG: MFS transporter [Gammaproteobacteria bacterium]|nr:MFS transporter [Gammaproteobacteria bacterium]
MIAVASEGSTSAAQTPRRYVVTLLLMLAYTLNSADRQLLAIIAQPLKLDLRLTDTQVGLLAGTAFAALYAFGSIPLARLAERCNRVNLLCTAMLLWSALTALCGAAARFGQLLVLRTGVGIAEAGCTPPAHSIISDYFAPPERATALSLYSCGISLGYILSAMLGSYLALRYGWRVACVAVGLPGVVMAAVLKLGVPEPARTAAPLPSDLRAEWQQLRLVGHSLLGRWPLANFLCGVTVAAFAAQGSWAFIPSLFNRAFGLDYARVGLVAALTGGVAVGAGLLAGGPLADYLARRDVRWYAYVPALGLLLATPLFVLAFLQDAWQRSAVLLGAAGFLQYLSFGPTVGVVQNVVEPRQRATATALIYVVLNVVALGGGALFTGWLIDRFAESHLHHLRAAASFEVLCPGGGALRPAGAALCRQTLAAASREGIIVTVLLYGWAALHYLLGAKGLRRCLRSAS